MRLSRDEIQRVKQAHPITELIARYVASLSPHGERLEANCPFPWYDDTTPSFMIYPQRQTFRCFGCGVGGDIFDFLRYYYSWSFAQALAHLAGEPVTVPHTPFTSKRGTEGPLKAAPRRAEAQDHREVLTRASMSYQTVLMRQPEAQAYLNGRGVTFETVRRLHLGYSDGRTFLAHLRGLSQRRAAAQAAGVLNDKGRERLANRIVIPELREGLAVYLIGRVLPPHSSRYKYLGTAAPKHLLGYGEAVARLAQVPE